MNVSTHTAVSNLESEPGVSMGDVSTSGMTRSQMSVGQAGSSTTLSMREKAARKRRVNAQHNSNFRAGYVPVEEEALHRSGIRGRKRYFLYCVVTILMITAVLNTMMTAWLLYILGLSYHGLASIELTTVAGRQFLRVLAEARIISMSFREAPLGARYNSSLVLEARQSALQIESSAPAGGSSIKLEGSDITVTTNKFAVSVNDNYLVLANLPSLAAYRTINNLFVDNVTTSLIQEMKSRDDLYVESQKNISISAGQEVNIVSKKTLEISAFHIFMNAQKSVTMDTKHGIYMKTLPRVGHSDDNTNVLTYKVCVCQSGRLFTVPATGPGVSCDIGLQLHSVCGDTLRMCGENSTSVRGENSTSVCADTV